jgi:hypothetical protein
MLSLTPGADDRSRAKRLSSVDVWPSVCDKLDLPSGPGQEDWMTVTFKLQLADGTPGTSPATAPRSKRLERRQRVGRAVFVTAAGPAAAG